MPWGLFYRNGHRVLFSDGIIRACEMAQTADTFSSIPARCRIKGQWFTGYVTTNACTRGGIVYSFRQHVNADTSIVPIPFPLPEWPTGDALQALIDSVTI